MARPQEERNLATCFITSLKENRLFQILEPRVVREGTLDQLEKAAQLVKSCLNLNGEERPTMKEVAMEIESLSKFTKHLQANQHRSEESTSLTGHTEAQFSDLYEISPSCYDNGGNDSELYSLSTAGTSYLHP
ncbi:Protein kinase domain-containing protein [Heracleum sosnowskyi]|uniref:Protein kinase domain-containing protein n=1 Tax=Heracleum sosnowskyi TaxID=360622 RepID=A0AAD8M154_9APIA|nr:Protein kinase domain-containing protein [Heracleum sosnowskyi]